MTKWSFGGLLLIVAGGVMLVFQKISGLVGSGAKWASIRIMDLCRPESLHWIDHMTFLGINHLLDKIVAAPLYIVLFCAGILLMIVSGFTKS